MIHTTPSPVEFEYPEVNLSNSELGMLEWVLKSNRDSWQNARGDPNQDYRENDIHDTVSVLNDLISRVTELRLTEVGGGTLSINTPREMDEILFGTLLCLQGIQDGEVELGTQDSDAVAASYKSLLSRFTDAHWEDNPLAEYWHEFGDLTPASPSDPIIKAIVEHGERTHVLRELMARRNMEYTVSALENPERLNADPDDPDDVAQKFIAAWDETRGSMGSHQYQMWLDAAEERVGAGADFLYK
ncbi:MULTISPECIES: hypothetical protein [Haloferacaceae]|uniref:Uncharacterized protein n=2 Tax=Haloferacaceae TaxID=1644056 RepID=A0ABD6DBM3_9EURY|nr:MULTISPECIES: hypothetical protein [Halorubraceae]